jgi:hypothetical protein
MLHLLPLWKTSKVCPYFIPGELSCDQIKKKMKEEGGMWTMGPFVALPFL